MSASLGSAHEVGPVLLAGVTADAIIAAIKAENEGVSVLSRGAYLRVRVARECVMTRARVEAELGRAFRLPSDLEAVMPSFVGRLSIGEERVSWSL